MTVTLRVLQLSGEVLLEDSFPSDAHVSNVRDRIYERLRQLHPQERPKKMRLLLGDKMLENNEALASLDLPTSPEVAELQVARLNDYVFTKYTGRDQIQKVTTKPITIYVGGSLGAGKTSICTRFVGEEFQETEYFDDVMRREMYSVVLGSDGGTLRQLRVIDGARRHKAYLRYVHGVMVVFSVDDRESFLSARNYLFDARAVDRPELQICVVASKVDQVLDANRVVTEDEARSFCERNGFAYYEVSAKDDFGIDEMFADVICKIDELESAPPAPGPDSSMESMMFQAMFH